MFNKNIRGGSGCSMQIHESAENYLETILILKNRNGNVRSVDIANELSFSKPSISNAVKSLRENGYVSVAEDGNITLTAAGLAVAEKIYERHLLLTQFLAELGVNEATAAADACKIEHDISEESFEKLKAHILSYHENRGRSQQAEKV